ncbi:MAG: InlB B-repeat-containing protein [Paludibacter sp.]
MKNRILKVCICIFISSIFFNHINAEEIDKSMFVQKVSSSVQDDPWVLPTGTQYVMPVVAIVKKNGVLNQPDGQLLGIFKNNICWGYTTLTDGPSGQLYILTAMYSTNNVTGFTYKVYDSNTNQFYDVVETSTFVKNTTIGTLDVPKVLNLKFAISRSSGNETMGTVSGTANGSFTSGTSISVTATPLSGYRFLKWTDGVGGTVMSNNANYTFTANENRNLIANFAILPVASVTSTIATSTITEPEITDVTVSTANGILNVDGSVGFKSLSLENGGKVSLPDTKSLTISGNFMLKSDVTNGTATFVDLNPNGGLTVTGTTTVQQYLTGAGGASPSGRFWYIGTPVVGATSAVFDAEGANQLWYYNEPTHTYIEITDNITPLEVGKGYVVRLGANTTVNFTGTLVTGSKTINLTKTAGDVKSGYNLIVNPYPSFINISTALPAAGSVYRSIWTRAENASNQMVFDSYSAALNIGVSASGKSATPYIAPMQAYWVKLMTGTTGTLSVSNSIRTIKDVEDVTNRLKSPAMTSQSVLKLRVSNGVNSDETVIAFNENADNNLDSYDTPKMSNNNVMVPEIYSVVNGEKVAINGMNSFVYNEEYALGFTTGQSTSFTIKSTKIDNFDSDTKIILLDKLLNKQMELTPDAEYTYASDVASSSTRFSIIFKSAAGTTDLNRESVGKHVCISNYMNGQINVSLSNSDDSKASIRLFNTLGQILETQYSTGKTTIINKQLKSGIYFVNVNVSGVNTTKKLIVD